MSSLSEKFDWYEPHQKWIHRKQGGVRARLYGASLEGAIFYDGFTGTKGTEVRHLSNVGSEKGILVIVNCLEGHFINRGCFRGSVSEFLDAVDKKHGKNEHGKFYRGVMKLYCRGEFKKWKQAKAEGADA